MGMIKPTPGIYPRQAPRATTSDAEVRVYEALPRSLRKAGTVGSAASSSSMTCKMRKVGMKSEAA